MISRKYKVLGLEFRALDFFLSTHHESKHNTADTKILPDLCLGNYGAVVSQGHGGFLVSVVPKA